MLGFNFYPPSSRFITPETCANIISSLITRHASLITVGIFVNESPKSIRTIMENCNLDLVQLCGDESAEDFVSLDGRAFKAIRPQSITDADILLKKYARGEAPTLLVDSHVTGVYGGTGETGDWAVARHLAEQAPILLAGGLNPENVATAVRAVNPWGVDVASGVESSPGVKHTSKISVFCSAAKSVKT